MLFHSNRSFGILAVMRLFKVLSATLLMIAGFYSSLQALTVIPNNYKELAA